MPFDYGKYTVDTSAAYAKAGAQLGSWISNLPATLQADQAYKEARAQIADNKEYVNQLYTGANSAAMKFAGTDKDGKPLVTLRAPTASEAKSPEKYEKYVVAQLTPLFLNESNGVATDKLEAFKQQLNQMGIGQNELVTEAGARRDVLDKFSGQGQQPPAIPGAAGAQQGAVPDRYGQSLSSGNPDLQELAADSSVLRSQYKPPTDPTVQNLNRQNGGAAPTAMSELDVSNDVAGQDAMMAGAPPGFAPDRATNMANFQRGATPPAPAAQPAAELPFKSTQGPNTQLVHDFAQQHLRSLPLNSPMASKILELELNAQETDKKLELEREKQKTAEMKANQQAAAKALVEGAQAGAPTKKGETELDSYSYDDMLANPSQYTQGAIPPKTVNYNSAGRRGGGGGAGGEVDNTDTLEKLETRITAAEAQYQNIFKNMATNFTNAEEERALKNTNELYLQKWFLTPGPAQVSDKAEAIAMTNKVNPSLVDFMSTTAEPVVVKKMRTEPGKDEWVEVRKVNMNGSYNGVPMSSLLAVAARNDKFNTQDFINDIVNRQAEAVKVAALGKYSSPFWERK